jgi:hypothetical protein
VVVVVRQFTFADEGLRTARGPLAAVAVRVPQLPLPAPLAQAVAAELDTAGSAARLLRVLETAARVVGNGYGGGSAPVTVPEAAAAAESSEGAAVEPGGRGVALVPRTLLSSVVEGVLRVPPRAWAALCPLAVRRGATLQHLRDLLLAVEACGLGHLSPAHAVAERFKEPLSSSDGRDGNDGSDGRGGNDGSSGGSSGGGGSSSSSSSSSSSPSVAHAWAAALAALPLAPLDRAACLGPVLGAFRDLLAGPLAEPSGFGAAESLRLFLGYQDDDLLGSGSPGCGWFRDHFPNSLRLEHALVTYLALTAAASDTAPGGHY